MALPQEVPQKGQKPHTSHSRSAPTLTMIPIERIDVLNPRDRNQRVFEEMLTSIRTLGLKKPITVTPRSSKAEDQVRYTLVCGEGRLRAFKELGKSEIPALVVQVSDEDALIMSLAENMTRRLYRPIEVLQAIEKLSEAGYDNKTISAKTGLHHDYVKGILALLKRGEERLLIAVESGRLPVTAAIAIMRAGEDVQGVQKALQEAYESGQLRGKQLLFARQVVDRRQLLGSGMSRRMPRKRGEVTASSLVRSYQREVERQRQMVKKADQAQAQLVFFVGAMRKLLEDEHFATLLRAERLESMPKFLLERVNAGAGAV